MSAPPEPPENNPGSNMGHSRPVVAVPLVVAGICLAIPFGAMLWVDSYSRLTPALIGIPFFYWYQMLWVVLSTVLTVVAYLLVRRHEAARRGGERK
ncbi:DUF3311 domain-containing protein [Streptomyces morookaense]|nr:DUF3311 domain-containing protein [Streptomyces morookaense]GHF14335.1 hypothetical protein GCM10010359_14530 [Streptomyces morookaense]